MAETCTKDPGGDAAAQIDREALNTYGGSDASFVDVDVHAGCDLE